MSDQEKPNDSSLVPAKRCDLAPVAGSNPLVVRGISDLAELEERSSIESSAQRPFDVPLLRSYKKVIKILLRVQELNQANLKGEQTSHKKDKP